MNEFDDRELGDALRRRAGAATDGFGIEAARSAVVARAARVRRRRAAVAGGAAMAGLIAAAVLVVGPGTDSVVTTPADSDRRVAPAPVDTPVDTTASVSTDPDRDRLRSGRDRHDAARRHLAEPGDHGAGGDSAHRDVDDAHRRRPHHRRPATTVVDPPHDAAADAATPRHDHVGAGPEPPPRRTRRPAARSRCCGTASLSTFSPRPRQPGSRPRWRTTVPIGSGCGSGATAAMFGSSSESRTAKSSGSNDLTQPRRSFRVVSSPDHTSITTSTGTSEEPHGQVTSRLPPQPAHAPHGDRRHRCDRIRPRAGRFRRCPVRLRPASQADRRIDSSVPNTVGSSSSVSVASTRPESPRPRRARRRRSPTPARRAPRPTTPRPAPRTPHPTTPHRALQLGARRTVELGARHDSARQHAPEHVELACPTTAHRRPRSTMTTTSAKDARTTTTAATDAAATTSRIPTTMTTTTAAPAAGTTTTTTRWQQRPRRWRRRLIAPAESPTGDPAERPGASAAPQAERRRAGAVGLDSVSVSAHGPTRTRPGVVRPLGVEATAARTTARAPASTQGVGRGPQRRPGGHDVVDDEHPLVAYVGSGDERRTGETTVAPETGLRAGAGRPLEQPARRQPQLAGDLASDEFGLIEPPPPAAGGARGRPCHDLDVAPRSKPFGHHAVDEQTGEVSGELTPIAVLEPEDDVADAPGEGQRGDDPAVGPAERGARRRTGEGEATGTAQRHTWSVTTGTTGLEQHVPRCSQGV